MAALPATMATAPPALALLPDMVTRSSTRMLLVLVRIPPPLEAAPLFPFRMKIPATLSRAPAATSKIRKTVATVGSRLIVVLGPPTIVTFLVITGSPSVAVAGVVMMYVQFAESLTVAVPRVLAYLSVQNLRTSSPLRRQ